LVDDHGSDELGAFTHASNIDEVPFCDSELEASKEICEASLWPPGSSALGSGTGGFGREQVRRRGSERKSRLADKTKRHTMRFLNIINDNCGN
jgi:hypothetical protein